MKNPKVAEITPTSYAELQAELSAATRDKIVRTPFSESYNPQPITCGSDKGTGEGTECVDWVEQAAKDDPKFAERMIKRHYEK